MSIWFPNMMSAIEVSAIKYVRYRGFTVFDYPLGIMSSTNHRTKRLMASGGSPLIVEKFEKKNPTKCKCYQNLLGKLLKQFSKIYQL